jgi:hypothetical protein
MDDRPRRTPLLRAFRLWLIKNGFSETDADAALEEIANDLSRFSVEHNKGREAISHKIARHLARKRRGETATPKELETLHNHYYLYIIGLSTGVVAPHLDHILGSVFNTARSFIETIGQEISETIRKATGTPSPAVKIVPLPASERMPSQAPVHENNGKYVSPNRLKQIGPVSQLRFSKDVGEYLRGDGHRIPRHAEKICLRNFFATLSRTGVTVPYKEIIPPDNVFIVATCGHVVTFTNYGRRVVKIERGILAKID